MDAPNAAGLAINVACGERFTLNELLEHIADITGSDVSAEYAPGRSGDVPHSQADISLARDVLGYEVQVQLREGLAETVAYYAAQQRHAERY
jgi:nucleoside-diphosphate-sugar epimerase